MVHINDFVSSSNQCLYFDENDYLRMDAHWNEEDARLVSYQQIPLFTGLTKYSELSTEHIRVLIDFVFGFYDDLTELEKTNESNPVTQMFHFVILALANKITLETGAKVECMRITRIDKKKITFLLSSYMDMAFDLPSNNSKKFKVVVNRDKTT